MRGVLVLLALSGCTQFSFTGKPGDDPPPDDGVNPDTAPPEAICGARPDPAAPRTEVTWLGESSFDPDGNPLLNWRWSLREAPEGSVARLPVGAANVAGFLPDLVGVYVATLTVTDSAGNVSLPCTATLDVQPAHDLWVELWWEYDAEDLDLHVLRDDGTLTAEDDCSAAGCAHDWGTPGDTTDDPQLLLDDVDGRGPELIGILAPDQDESFVIGAVDNAPPVRSADNTANLRVWLDGALRYEGSKVFSNELQSIQFVRVDPGRGTVEEL
jgi:hypothetical protein